MILITSNEELCRFVPNVALTVDGETSLYEKIYAWLELAEDELKDNVVGDLIADIYSDSHRKLLMLSQFVVANKAMAMAVPSLDLIMTPNGFGIVNTNNVAPASKERVERLIAKCEETSNRFLDMLVQNLADNTDWLSSKQGEFYRSTTLTYPYRTVKACKGDTADSLNAFKDLVSRAKVIESELAEKWISDAVMVRLRHALIDNTMANPIDKNFGLMVRSLVIAELNNEQRDLNALRYIVNQLRDSELFPEWKMSDTAKIYNVEPYRNDKQKGGYWL